MTDIVNSIVKKIGNFFETQPVRRAWLFGSYARGEERPDSDMDILVEFEEYVSLLTYSGIKLDLEELLQKKVDLVEEDSLYAEIVSNVDKDKILIYERNR